MQIEATESSFERQLFSGINGGMRGVGRVPFARLAYFRECANLRFQGLVVLPLDLKFGLKFLHKQVQMGNLDTKFLDVGCGQSWPSRGAG